MWTGAPLVLFVVVIVLFRVYYKRQVQKRMRRTQIADLHNNRISSALEIEFERNYAKQEVTQPAGWASEEEPISNRKELPGEPPECRSHSVLKSL